MKYICKICGKEFIRYSSKERGAKYCSKECAAIGRTTISTVNLKCDYCGKPITKKANNIKKNNFCSLECANNYQKRNKTKFICKTCGKEFYRSPSWIKQKCGYYCSLECRNKDENWRVKAIYKSNQIQNKKREPNKLEKAGYEILDELNLKYETEYLINDKICVDVYIKDYNLIIQWDGNYWHGKDTPYNELDSRQKKRVDLDKSQDAYLKKCGFNELRFWEDEVMNRKEYVYGNIKDTIRKITERVS